MKLALEREEILKDCHSFFVNETELNDELLSDVLMAGKTCASSSKDEYAILSMQAVILATNIAGELAKLDSFAGKYETVESAAELEDLEQKMEASKTTVRAFKEDFDKLCKERSSLPIGKSLSERYRRDPFNAGTLKLAGKEALLEIAEKDLLYLSKSKFIAESYGKYVGTNNEQFFRNAANQLANMKEVMSDSGVVVEISSCEVFDSEPLIAAGTVMHPATAQTIFEQLESETRAIKRQAEACGEYYPCVRCKIAVFVPIGEDVAAIHTRVDIGDGCQDSLLDHLEQCSTTAAATSASGCMREIMNAFNAALAEDCKDKQHPPQLECAISPKRKTISMADLEDTILEKRLERAVAAMIQSAALEAANGMEENHAKN